MYTSKNFRKTSMGILSTLGILDGSPLLFYALYLKLIMLLPTARAGGHKVAPFAFV